MKGEAEGTSGVCDRSDDVSAQNAVGFGVNNDFDEALGIVIAFGARVRQKREFADAVLQVLGFAVLLGREERQSVR